MAVNRMKKIRHDGDATLVDIIPQSGGATSVTSNDITDATTLGKSLLTAADASAARTAVGLPQQAAMADLTGAPTQADFNALLAALRAAGILAS